MIFPQYRFYLHLNNELINKIYVYIFSINHRFLFNVSIVIHGIWTKKLWKKARFEFKFANPMALITKIIGFNLDS